MYSQLSALSNQRPTLSVEQPIKELECKGNFDHETVASADTFRVLVTVFTKLFQKLRTFSMQDLTHLVPFSSLYPERDVDVPPMIHRGHDVGEVQGFQLLLDFKSTSCFPE